MRPIASSLEQLVPGVPYARSELGTVQQEPTCPLAWSLGRCRTVISYQLKSARACASRGERAGGPTRTGARRPWQHVVALAFDLLRTASNKAISPHYRCAFMDQGRFARFRSALKTTFHPASGPSSTARSDWSPDRAELGPH